MEKENNGTVFDGGVDDLQVKKWKALHRKVYRIEIEDEGEKHVGYFKRPDFATMKAVTKVSKTDEVEAGKVLFENCFLGGSGELRRDAVLFMGVQSQLGKLLTGCTGSLKNL